MLKRSGLLFFVLCFIIFASFAGFSQTTDTNSESSKTQKQKNGLIPSSPINENISLIQGGVIDIYSGDMISIQTQDKKIYSIRLQAIDAPDERQIYGKDSKEKLANLILNKSVIVLIGKKDFYDRYVANVYFEGQDVGLLQIKAGMAWHFKKYSDDQTAENRKKYNKAEEVARIKRVGLWEENNPKPPWVFLSEINGTAGRTSKNEKTTKNSNKGRKKTDREYIRGSRGGCYYINASGRKTYVKNKSLCDN